VDLYKEINAILSQIPKGRISTYKEVAKALGDENIARVLPNMIKNFSNAHRVIRSNGDVRGKEKFLAREGIEVKKGKIHVKNYLFKDFITSHPLRKLREEQIELRKKVCLEDKFEEIKTIAGMDVAYDGKEGYGAYVEMDMDGNVIKEKVIRKEITFPYIPSYLAYREIPILNELIKKEKPSVALIDGNGILHPYKFGIACHFGVLNNIASIGIAKKVLCGEVKNSYIYIGDEKVGMTYAKNAKPIYISPGHNISLESASMITMKLCEYRIPEPLRKAHISANRAKRFTAKVI